MKSIALTIFFSLMLNTFAGQKKFNNQDGLFLSGYDPVSYLVSEKAIKGKPEFQITYKNSTINFSTKENRDAFIKSPEKYIPAYNGWCAYAIYKDGSLVEVDPESFKIIDGKTYLFYNGFWADTLKEWNKLSKDSSDKSLVEHADTNWSKAD